MKILSRLRAAFFVWFWALLCAVWLGVNKIDKGTNLSDKPCEEDFTRGDGQPLL